MLHIHCIACELAMLHLYPKTYENSRGTMSAGFSGQFFHIFNCFALLMHKVEAIYMAYVNC